MSRVSRRTPVAAGAFALLLAAGCGGPATFVSPDPPPDTTADAWFLSGVPAVGAAVRQAMTEHGMAIDAAKSSATVVVASRQQLPYVDESSGRPASGPLPAYRVRAVLSRAGETRVRLTIAADCRACDGATPYEWQYPVDLTRRVFERTRAILGERRPRFAYPPRYRPVRWRRP
jgi:hypothetical protein